MNLSEITYLEKACPPSIGELKHVHRAAQRYLSLMKLADLIEGEDAECGFVQIRNNVLRGRSVSPITGRLMIEACAMGKVLVRLRLGSGDIGSPRFFTQLPGLTKDDMGRVIELNDREMLSFGKIAERIRHHANESRFAAAA